MASANRRRALTRLRLTEERFLTVGAASQKHLPHEPKRKLALSGRPSGFTHEREHDRPGVASGDVANRLSDPGRSRPRMDYPSSVREKYAGFWRPRDSLCSDEAALFLEISEAATKFSLSPRKRGGEGGGEGGQGIHPSP